MLLMNLWLTFVDFQIYKLSYVFIFDNNILYVPTRGEKYLGMWEADKRHGVGMLVTLDGLYCQGL